MSDDRRNGPRHPALLFAELHFGDVRAMTALIYDLGADGLSLLCDPPLDRMLCDGARGKRAVRVRVAVAAAEDVQVSGRLLYCNGCRTGVKFEHADGDDARVLVRACLDQRLVV